MRSSAELRETRDLIAARQRLAVEVDRVQSQLLLDVDQGRELRRGIWRCDQPHTRRGAPKLGETIEVDGAVVLAVTKIAWLPSDQLNLRPWSREHLLGVEGSALKMGDQELSRWLDYLDEWEAGRQASGPRPVRAQDTSVIATLVGMDAEPVIGAWWRCKDHPDSLGTIERRAAWASMR